jgi:RimJ/RimL family protein N-acetyltransferase
MQLEGDTLILRPLTEADLPDLLKIYIGTPLYFDALGVNAQTLTLDDVQAQWQAAQTTPGRMLLAVEQPVVNLLIGVVDVQTHAPEPGVATLWLLLIWGGFQRQGYGQEVAELLEEWLLSQEDIGELRVVAAANDEGLSFWQLRGYVSSGEAAVAPIRNAPAHWLIRGANV